MIVFVTTADTEILALSRVARDLPDGFPAIKALNPTHLPRDLAPETLVSGASLVLVRLLGGRRAWEDFNGVAAYCRRTGIPFLAWSGEQHADAELTAASTAPTAIVGEAFAYLCHGGVDNLRQPLLFLSDTLLMTGYGFEPPTPLPDYGIYHPAFPEHVALAHILPTGRNFYSVDPKALPSPIAYQVGTDLANALIAKYLADEGTYPESVGMVVWGTSAMRTQGDDIGEVLALLGVRPVWQAESRRVTGIEVLPLAELGRPRIDVTLRISGFFRDAFPNLVHLVDEAIGKASLGLVACRAGNAPGAQARLEKELVPETRCLETIGQGVGQVGWRWW